MGRFFARLAVVLPAALSTLALTMLAALMGPSACKHEHLPAGHMEPEVRALLGHLPADARVVGAVDLARARTSGPLGQALRDFLPDPPTPVQLFRKACDLDPVRDVDLLVFAATGDLADPDQRFVAVKGSFTRAQVHDCVSHLGETQGTPVKPTATGPLTRYTAQGGGAATVYWPAPDVAIAPYTGTAEPESMSQILTGPSVLDNPEIMSMIGLVDTDSTLWLAGRVPPRARARMTQATAAEPSGFFFSADLAGPRRDGAELRFGLRLASSASAAGTADLLRVQLAHLAARSPSPTLAAAIRRVSVTKAGRDLELLVTLSEEELDALLALAPELPRYSGGP